MILHFQRFLRSFAYRFPKAAAKVLLFFNPPKFYGTFFYIWQNCYLELAIFRDK